MQLKESESKLESMLLEKKPDNEEVPASEDIVESASANKDVRVGEDINEAIKQDKSSNIKNSNDSLINNNLKKVTNIENEQLNKSLQNVKSSDDSHALSDIPQLIATTVDTKLQNPEDKIEGSEASHNDSENNIEIVEIECTPSIETEIKKDDQHLNAILRKNILSCVEKVALIEEMKNKCKSPTNQQEQVSAYGCGVPSVPLSN